MEGNMEKIKCSRCGEKFESTGESSFCVNCRRKRHTKAYLYAALIILIIGFIGGIVLGNTFLDYYEEFNFLLMLYVWIGTLLSDLFVFAIHSICYRLDLIIDKKEN
jgi:hypothetical protein